ncbi:MAG TPA: phosphate ABC transporter permease PstA [Armatimonadota bacterium]|nr:phosphate ABC transporter permease PstA [Armatimonadota bacterium]
MKSAIKQKLAFALMGLTTIVVIVPALVIIGIIVKEGAPALSWEFLTTFPAPGMVEGGIFPAIVGTICLVVAAVVFAVPFGVFAAIYLNEYASENFLTRLVRLAIINLAGVPSIVYALFGMALFVNYMKLGASILAGGLTLAVMNLPVIITASKEALDSVPQHFREASLSLGVSKWQTIRHIVLPNAIPGILTGIILEVSRAAGETAPILFCAAALYKPELPTSVFEQVMALPYHLYIIATSVPGVSSEQKYGTALVLLGLVFAFNFFAILLRARLRAKRKW